MNVAIALKRKTNEMATWLPSFGLVMAAALFVGAMASGTVQANADNFTDIFQTNSFRGAFAWLEKLDWVGMIVQCVISCFSLFGVALMTIRIMTSMLYLSAKGMWEEVATLKDQGGSEEKDFIGMFGMAKSWAKGNAGTGLDAIIGAGLMLLPNVKKYSDFGANAKEGMSEDMTISQYILKIALPTVMTVFFFAMGFNGTLWQALAVSVDMMGAFADKAVSVDYAGIVEDIINSKTGYQFYLNDGTNFGKLKQSVAKDVYNRAVSNMASPTDAQLYDAGSYIEEYIDTLFGSDSSNMLNWNIPKLDNKIKEGLGTDYWDEYVRYLGATVMVTRSATQNGSIGHLVMSDVMAAAGMGGVNGEQYIHICVRQDSSYSGAYINVGEPTYAAPPETTDPETPDPETPVE